MRPRQRQASRNTTLPKAMRPKITHIGGISLNANFKAINELPHKAMATTKQPQASAWPSRCCTHTSAFSDGQYRNRAPARPATVEQLSSAQLFYQLHPPFQEHDIVCSP